jgi:molybdopterin molybdotransferase
VTAPAPPRPIPLDDAVALVLAEARTLAAEQVALDDARGRVLARPLLAPDDVPAWDASLMDGYALGSTDFTGEPLNVAYELRAGSVAPRPVGKGECARIFTGAPLPPGADAVVKQEDTTREYDRVRPLRAPAPGEHVRARGSDAKAGTVLLPAGTTLDAGALCLAASLGLPTVPVVRRPLVGLLATGDELVRAGEPLPTGSVYEANTHGLAAQVEDAGGTARRLGLAKDDPDAIARTLDVEACDVLVTSGGASVGAYDFAGAVLARLGGRRVFWQVAIRPGRPVLFGVIERAGRTPCLFFALPGNPGASALTFDLLVRPAMLRMVGASKMRRPRVRATLASVVKKPAELTQLVRGRLVARDGSLVFVPHAAQGSMSVTSLARLGAVALVPPGVSVLEAGAAAWVEPWGPVEADEEGA